VLDPFHPEVRTLLARERAERLRESMPESRSREEARDEPLRATVLLFPPAADPCLERRLRSVGS
jgi:hypothetical protein